MCWATSGVFAIIQDRCELIQDRVGRGRMREPRALEIFGFQILVAIPEWGTLTKTWSVAEYASPRCVQSEGPGHAQGKSMSQGLL